MDLSRSGHCDAMMELEIERTQIAGDPLREREVTVQLISSNAAVAGAPLPLAAAIGRFAWGRTFGGI